MKHRNTTPSRFRNYFPAFHFQISVDKFQQLQLDLTTGNFPLITMVKKPGITQEAINDFFNLSGTTAKVAIWNNRNLSNAQLSKFQDCLSYYIPKIDISQLENEPFIYTGPHNDWIVQEQKGNICIYPS